MKVAAVITRVASDPVTISQRSRMTRPLALSGRYLLYLLSAVLLASCGSGSGMAAPTTITITAMDYRFTPSSVTLPAGKPITLIFKNAGTMMHDFHIVAGPGIPTPPPAMPGMTGQHMQMGPYHVDADPGQQGTVMFTLSPGTYTFICSVADHRQLGMEGTITVK